MHIMQQLDWGWISFFISLVALAIAGYSAYKATHKGIGLETLEKSKRWRDYIASITLAFLESSELWLARLKEILNINYLGTHFQSLHGKLESRTTDLEKEQKNLENDRDKNHTELQTLFVNFKNEYEKRLQRLEDKIKSFIDKTESLETDYRDVKTSLDRCLAKIEDFAKTVLSSATIARIENETQMKASRAEKMFSEAEKLATEIRTVYNSLMCLKCPKEITVLSEAEIQVQATKELFEPPMIPEEKEEEIALDKLRAAPKEKDIGSPLEQGETIEDFDNFEFPGVPPAPEKEKVYDKTPTPVEIQGRVDELIKKPPILSAEKPIVDKTPPPVGGDLLKKPATSHKFCPDCYKSVEEEAIFCPACGFNLLAKKTQVDLADQKPKVFDEGKGENPFAPLKKALGGIGKKT